MGDLVRCWQASQYQFDMILRTLLVALLSVCAVLALAEASEARTPRGEHGPDEVRERRRRGLDRDLQQLASGEMVGADGRPLPDEKDFLMELYKERETLADAGQAYVSWQNRASESEPPETVTPAWNNEEVTPSFDNRQPVTTQQPPPVRPTSLPSSVSPPRQGPPPGTAVPSAPGSWGRPLQPPIQPPCPSPPATTPMPSLGSDIYGGRGRFDPLGGLFNNLGQGITSALANTLNTKAAAARAVAGTLAHSVVAPVPVVPVGTRGIGGLQIGFAPPRIALGNLDNMFTRWL